MGPSQEAKASPWRQASSSSSCLGRTGSSKALRRLVVTATLAQELRWTHFLLLRRSFSAGPRVPVLLMATGSPAACSSEGVDAAAQSRGVKASCATLPVG